MLNPAPGALTYMGFLILFNSHTSFAPLGTGLLMMPIYTTEVTEGQRNKVTYPRSQGKFMVEAMREAGHLHLTCAFCWQPLREQGKSSHTAWG
jgi:hypothetical protein